MKSSEAPGPHTAGGVGVAEGPDVDDAKGGGAALATRSRRSPR